METSKAVPWRKFFNRTSPTAQQNLYIYMHKGDPVNQQAIYIDIYIYKAIIYIYIYMYRGDIAVQQSNSIIIKCTRETTPSSKPDYEKYVQKEHCCVCSETTKKYPIVKRNVISRVAEQLHHQASFQRDTSTDDLTEVTWYWWAWGW